MKNRPLYIAYGSNLNLEQMEYRCPTAQKLSQGLMHGYELEFRGVATIVPKSEAKTPVLLWEIEPSDERALDRYEGYPRLYRKEYFDIEICGERRTAMAYIMNGGEINIPSEHYYKVIRDGYEANGLDVSYLENALQRAVEHNLQMKTIDEPEQLTFGFPKP